MRTTIANALVGASTLARQVDDLIARLQKVEAFIGDSELRLEQSAVAYTTVNDQRIDAERRAEALAQANSDLAHQVSLTHRNLDARDATINNLTMDLQGLRIDAAAAQTRIEDLQTSLREAYTTIDDLNKEITSLRAAKDSEEDAHLLSLSELDRLRKQSSDLQHKLDTIHGITSTPLFPELRLASST